MVVIFVKLPKETTVVLKADIIIIVFLSAGFCLVGFLQTIRKMPQKCVWYIL